jgi:hypothetical protein
VLQRILKTLDDAVVVVVVMVIWPAHSFIAVNGSRSCCWAC